MEIKKEHLILGAVAGGVAAAVASYLATRAIAAPAPLPPIVPPGKKVYETRISISAPKQAYVNEPFGVMGSLRAVVDGSAKPLMGETVEIYVDGRKVLTTTTGNNGVFNVNITIYRAGIHTITARYPGRETADAVYKPSEASATVKVVERPIQPPPPPQPTVTISASKNELREDPEDYVTVRVCWSNYKKSAYPPDRGDYYGIGVFSETESIESVIFVSTRCPYDEVLVRREYLPEQGCAEFTARFIQEFIPGTNSWYYPCLGTLRGYVGRVKSQNTVEVRRVLVYSINDITGLGYEPSTGTVYLKLARDVKNMAIIFMAWTEDEYGNACRGLIELRNIAAPKGLWITSTQQRFNLFTGIYPQETWYDNIYICREKYVAVRIIRPDGVKELKAAMR